MKLKFLVDEDFVNFKEPSMFIGFPECSFKCGADKCHNVMLAKEPDIEVSKEEICERYISNPISKAIVFGGLEPFDTTLEVMSLVDTIRYKYEIEDPIVIYTGYTYDEIKKGYREGKGCNKIMAELWQDLLQYGNLYVKFGRYDPSLPSYHNDILGVTLASDNQQVVRFK